MSGEEILVAGRRATVSWASARQTFSPPGSPTGDWTLQAVEVGVFTAGASADPTDHPDGVLEFREAGGLNLEVTDVPGMAPYILIQPWTGAPQAPEEVALSVEMGAGFSGTDRDMRPRPVAWDGQLGAHVSLGVTSDGSLANAGWTNLIVVRAADGNPWALARAGIGWLSLT